MVHLQIQIMEANLWNVGTHLAMECVLICSLDIDYSVCGTSALPCCILLGIAKLLCKLLRRLLLYNFCVLRCVPRLAYASSSIIFCVLINISE